MSNIAIPVILESEDGKNIPQRRNDRCFCFLSECKSKMYFIQGPNSAKEGWQHFTLRTNFVVVPSFVRQPVKLSLYDTEVK